MRLLCVDTSTFLESVAIVEGGEVLSERAVRRKKGHGPGILDDIDGALSDAGLSLAEIGGFVCGLGPGSFTGLRIALATLKGLALATGKPLYGAQTTRLLQAALPGAPVVAVLDARRGEVYVHGGAIETPQCCAPEAVRIPMVAPVLLGDGALKYAEALRQAVPAAVIPTAAALHSPRAALLPSLIDLDRPAALATLEPTYVRRSDAEINYPQGFPDALGRLPGR